jgi:hypothetical protein
MKRLSKKSFVAVLVTAVLLSSVSSSAVSARDTLWSGEALSTVGNAAATIAWDLPWGLDADPASVNIWTYPLDAVSVTLADVDWSMPSGLLIWHYGGSGIGWRFYKKGWGAVNTLETLTPGEGYIGVVPTAGVWEIRGEAEASATIGPEGGSIEVTDPLSPLCGTRLEIPEGALKTETLITIYEREDLKLPDSVVALGRIVSLGPAGATFSSPVKVHMPYEDTTVQDEDLVAAGIYDQALSYWDYAHVDSVDADRNIVVIETIHFSAMGVFAPSGDLERRLDTGFRPSKDGFPIDNFGEGYCLAMVGFAQWYYSTGKNLKYGDLFVRLCEEQAKNIAEALMAAMPQDYPIPVGISFDLRNDWIEAHRLKAGLLLSNKPQMLALGKDGVASHAVLVYAYEDGYFYVYDPNYSGDDNIRIHFDGTHLEFEDEEHKQSYNDFAATAACRYLTDAACDALFNGAKDIFESPIIRNVTPVGVVSELRPIISAWIESPILADIQLQSIQVTLDGVSIPHHVDTISSRVVYVSYTPDHDLAKGTHTVTVQASDINGVAAKEKEWTFVIGGGWCFTFYNRLPAVYLYAYPVEIYYVDEDYGPVTPVGMDIDFNEIPELAEFAQLWYVPVPEEPICIQVTREGDNIDASFGFTHEPTGYDVSAELSGMIVDSAVYFNINYYPPDGLRNYSMPLSYSDCMSEMEGTVYYSLPAVLTADYQGTITGGTIQGGFQAVIADQWARWRYHDREYSCAWGTTREELLFDGIVEWTLSNLRLSGDFRVDIGS